MNTMSYEAFEEFHREDIFHDVCQDYSEFAFLDGDKTHKLMECITDLIIERSYYKTRMQELIIQNDELKRLKIKELIKNQ